jgi:diacylglycerol kinase (ATP)
VSALHALSKHAPLEIRIDFPESELPSIEARALLAAILNSPSYGAGVRLAPGATIDDGWLDIVLVESLQGGEVLRLLPSLLASGELRTSRVKRWRAKRVRLTTSRPCLFHGDGEILGQAPVEIEALPRAIQVLAPLTN